MPAFLQIWASGGWGGGVLGELAPRLSECFFREVGGIGGLIGWVGLGSYVLNVE